MSDFGTTVCDKCGARLTVQYGESYGREHEINRWIMFRDYHFLPDLRRAAVAGPRRNPGRYQTRAARHVIVNKRVQRRVALTLAILSLFAVLWLAVRWSDRVMTDPDDQCTDQDSPALARFVVCTVERR